MEKGMTERVKESRIQVSNSKKSIFFYVNLSKRYLLEYGEAELSGLGMAVSTVVNVAEILKNSGFAVEQKITTLTIDMREYPAARPVPKAKIEVLLGKSAKFDELMAAEDRDRETEEADNQN